jgi:hypothetical protein
MRVETVQSVYTIHPHEVVRKDITTMIDPVTNKRSISIETYKITLYNSAGQANEWANQQHTIDRMV